MQEFVQDNIFLIFEDINPVLVEFLTTITMVGMLGGLFYLMFRLFSKRTRAVVWVTMIVIIALTCIFVIREAYQAKADYNQGLFDREQMNLEGGLTDGYSCDLGFGLCISESAPAAE